MQADGMTSRNDKKQARVLGRGAKAWLSILLALVCTVGKARKVDGSARIGARPKPKVRASINRPLSVTTGIFEGIGIQRAFREFDPNATVAALEVCCGEGRTILELQGMLPRSNLHCLNNPAYSRDAIGANLSGERKDLEPIIDRYKIHMKSAALPTVSFRDASAQAWLYPDGQMDVIFSTFCMMTRSFNLGVALSESKRSLAPGGEAFLHVGVVDGDRQHPSQAKQELCSQFGKDEPRALYCANGDDFTVTLYAVFAHTERKFLGQPVDKDDYHGVLHLIKERRDCPSEASTHLAGIDCFDSQSVTFEKVKAWAQFQQDSGGRTE